MRKKLLLAVALGGWLWAGSRVMAQEPAPIDPPSAATHALEQMREALPAARVYREGSQIGRIFGQPLSSGAAPEVSADAFVARYAEVFGVPPEDLAPTVGLRGERFVQPVLYDRQTDTYKFGLIQYQQQRGGIPVFRADLRLLVRNESDYPLVLAAASLKALGGFQPDLRKAVFQTEQAEAAFGMRTRYDAAGRELPSFPGGWITTSEPELVIWAGAEKPEEPCLAFVFTAENNRTDAGYEIWRFVTEAQTGKVLYQEDLIRFTDVSGTVQGMATEGAKSAECNPEVLVPYPWARLDISGGAGTYTNANGQFTIPNAGGSAVTVRSYVDGLYFTVDNLAGAEETLSRSVTPPGPADFIHNQANNSEHVRAQVNAYVSANSVRDWVLAQNPSFPGIATETGVQINVNSNHWLYCPGNAWSSSLDGSINFCASGSGYPNTAWQSVVNHEYGHHVIDKTSSGQGQYGEGIGDCFSMLLVDDPVLGYGFYGDCNSGLRNADNDLQYPCTDEVHYCGQLLSGAVWSTRNELVQTEPADYLDILSSLTVNSILLHAGESITPQIAIDFLTLDDDDANLDNGTPHYNEICAGFGAHNLECPPLLIGLHVSPDGGAAGAGPVGGPFTPASLDYTVQSLGPGAVAYNVTTTAAWLTITNGSGTLPSVGSSEVVTVTVNAGAAALPQGEHTATLYFVNTTDHAGDTTRTVTLTVGGPRILYEWNMDTNPGWTTQGNWAWGRPMGGGGAHGYPDPTAGHTGINVYGYNLNGDYTNSLPERHLTSTPIDCTGLSTVTLRFWRWLGVEQNRYDHAYVRVSNNGTNWTTIWQNPSVETADNSWVLQEFDISAVAADRPTVYLRWTMGSTDGAWTYCGWNIDDVAILAQARAGSGDMDEDGDVDLADFAAFQGCFGRYPVDGACAAGDMNADYAVNLADVPAFVAALEASGPQ